MEVLDLKAKVVRSYGALKLAGENLNIALVEFSTISLAVFVMSIIVWRRQACQTWLLNKLLNCSYLGHILCKLKVLGVRELET